MDLRNWEFYDSGDPLVGATVKVRDAILTHPNAGTVLATTTTDNNGAWTFTGLTDTAKDVEVIWGNVSQYHKWYKGMTQHSIGTLFLATIDGAGLVLSDNLLVNGDFIIDQQMRGAVYTSSSHFLNSDDFYTLDQWNLLSDGNNIVSVTRDTTAANIPSGSRAAVKLVVVTANKKFGLVQFVEQRASREVIGGVASLSFKARTTSAKVINNMRVGILTWSSTADTLTSDVVNTTNWGAAGTNPTLATNWTYENVPVNLALTTSWQTFQVENVPIDTASGANVAVFFWIDDTDAAVNDELWLADVMLVPGEVALPIRRRPVAEEGLLASYFLEVWGAGSNFSAGNGAFANSGAGVDIFDGSMTWALKRVTPTVSATTLTTTFGVLAGGAFYSGLSAFGVFSNQADVRGGLVRASYSAAPGPAAGVPGLFYATTARILVDARL